MQNGHVGSLHGKLRDECLNASWFGNLLAARVQIAAWKEECNEEWPHSSLGYVTPREELAKAKVMSSGDLGVV